MHSLTKKKVRVSSLFLLSKTLTKPLVFFACAPHVYMHICPVKDTHTHTTWMRIFVERVLMILPQVHLRKPCYDFSFL
jgi:hypothetical protein